MKRITSFLMMLGLCLMVMGQVKMTPQAQMRVASLKAKAKQAASMSRMPQKSQQIKLVVEVAADNASATYGQMKAAGATVCGKVGRQAVISIAVDSLEALQRIEGVTRIDKGHNGKWKTDIARQETGVSLLNGPSLPSTATAYTGKGITMCLIDGGFDFQHPAFKDADGNTRIKCVYLMGDDGGHPFTVDDPEAGSYTFPGSVYDTPELIATLTTDDDTECHGTHTAGIAAGSLSPLGFGGMAPEADLVLIPLNEVEVEGIDEDDMMGYVELALSFADAYARQSGQPTVLSASLNSHAGPHDGTSTVCQAIADMSENLIPVFSAGNEGGYPVHIHRQFTSQKKSFNTILIGMMEDEDGIYEYLDMASVTGYTRKGGEVSIQLALKNINMFTGKLTTLWTSEKCTATPGCEPLMKQVSSDDDATLAKYFEGHVAVGAFDNGDGRLCIQAMVEGGTQELYLFQLTVSGAAGTEIDLWDDVAGFGGTQYIGLPNLVDGDSDMSAGDWTCNDRVISVGAYCTNVLSRSYDGLVEDTSTAEDEDDDVDTLNDIAWFSSYGTSLNGVTQPVICAPGVNVVSSYNHYVVGDEAIADNMQWQGYPYSAESGTSMACPAVAGIVALWLQASPTMTFNDVRDVMANASRTDDYTNEDPDRWGYGKIDAAGGISYIIGLSTDIKDLEPQTNTAGHGYVYDLQGRRVVGATPAARLTKGLYIRQGKKVIIK